jgi:S-adenosylmethionine:tRNA ribosyltransferase-isomerase
MHPKNISILDYTYQLPDEKIALHPLEERDASKLLVYSNGSITTDTYKNIAAYLPEKSLLVFNNTKVINARLLFTKPTGGIVEIFLLEPYGADYVTTLTATKTCRWKCMIGGASKWKASPLLLHTTVATIEATLIEKLPDAYVVQLSWDNNISFASILQEAGNIPLPPYIKRKAEASDASRYQTVYAQHDGSVAAPTAGLHFTANVFTSLAAKNIRTDFVTLHVGAGTFKPVKAATMQEHDMHAEWIDVSASFIKNLLNSLQQPVIATGTTSLRTIESLYWLGVKAALQPNSASLTLSQWEVYDDLQNTTITAVQALTALLQWLQQHGQQQLFTQTQILIAPGYQFKIANAIITNFHQPQSTLLLLVAATVGIQWQAIYNHALQNDFRFLSYGDGSLLFVG